MVINNVHLLHFKSLSLRRLLFSLLICQTINTLWEEGLQFDVQPIVVQQTQRQQCKVAAHIPSAVRKERDEGGYSAFSLILSQPGTLAHGMVLPTFRVSLPTSFNSVWNPLTDSLLDDSTSCQVDNQYYPSVSFYNITKSGNLGPFLRG